MPCIIDVFAYQRAIIGVIDAPAVHGFEREMTVFGREGNMTVGDELIWNG